MRFPLWIGRVVASHEGLTRNVQLENDDVIVIPTRSTVVLVTGEVQVSQALAYEPGLTIGECIARSGGYSNRAQHRGMLVMRPSAEVVQANTSYVVHPGDMVIVMPHIDRMARQGIFGPTTPIDPTMLAVINVKAPGGTGMAMLSDVSNIPWPIALYGTKKQEKLQTSLDQAVKTIMTKGRLDPKTYSECQTNAKALRDELDQLFDAEKINMSRFAEGSSFMQALQKEVAHLGDPGIAKSLGGGMRPRGNDVLELVHYMTTTGLQFAPCRPGDEAAYQSLFTAMSGFAQSAQVAAGVSTQPSVPPPTAPYKK